MAGIEDFPTDGIEISSTQDREGNAVLTVTGDLDLLAADELRRVVTEALSGGTRSVVFELSGLRFIDSAGLAVLIEASSHAESVELRSPSTPVRRAVELTGLADVLKVVP